MWTKIEPTQGREPSKDVTVSKYSTGQAIVSLPKAMTSIRTANVFVDGTRIGILPTAGGAYALSDNGARWQLTVPSPVRHLIPIIKATPVSIWREGDMIVIETAQLHPRAVAAE